MRISIPVKESSFDVTVRHISPRTSFSFIAELVVYSSEKGRWAMFSSLLFTGKCDRCVSNESGQTYVRFTSKSIIKCDVMFSGKHLNTLLRLRR